MAVSSEILRFLGLMRRAGRLGVGEEGTGQAVRAGKACLLLLASDASPNARKRAEAFANRGKLPIVALKADKAALSDALGIPASAMLAVCDLGFARALQEKLRASDVD